MSKSYLHIREMSPTNQTTNHINKNDNIKNDDYAVPSVFLVSGPEVIEDVFSAKEYGTGRSIRIYPSARPGHAAVYKQFTSERQQLTVFAKMQIDILMSEKIGQAEEEFLYQNLHKI